MACLSVCFHCDLIKRNPNQLWTVNPFLFLHLFLIIYQISCVVLGCIYDVNFSFYANIKSYFCMFKWHKPNLRLQEHLYILLEHHMLNLKVLTSISSLNLIRWTHSVVSMTWCGKTFPPNPVWLVMLISYYSANYQQLSLCQSGRWQIPSISRLAVLSTGHELHVMETKSLALLTALTDKWGVLEKLGPSLWAVE